MSTFWNGCVLCSGVRVLCCVFRILCSYVLRTCADHVRGNPRVYYRSPTLFDPLVFQKGFLISAAAEEQKEKNHRKAMILNFRTILIFTFQFLIFEKCKPSLILKFNNFMIWDPHHGEGISVAESHPTITLVMVLNLLLVSLESMLFRKYREGVSKNAYIFVEWNVFLRKICSISEVMDDVWKPSKWS